MMDDLAGRLREAYAAVPPVTSSEAKTLAARRARARRLVVGTASVLAVIAALVGIGLSIRSGPVRTVTSGPSPTGAGAGSVRLGRAAGTVTARRDGITVRFTLETPAVRRGGALKGTLSITTLKAVRGCRGQFYAIVLSSPSTGPQGGSFSSVFCNRVAIAPGRHIYRVSSPARYGVCTNDRDATRKIPHCLQKPELPELPVGKYKAKLAFDLHLPVPPAVPVEIVAPR